MRSIESQLGKGVAIGLLFAGALGLGFFDWAKSQDGSTGVETREFTRVYRAQSPALEAVAIQADSTVKQGEVLKVSIPRPGTDCAYATLLDRKVSFFKQPDGSALALVPVSVFATPGTAALSVYDSSGQLLKAMDVTIQDAHYKRQNITVSKTTAGLKPLPGELEAIQALKDTVSGVRFWDEPFISPTPDCQNSPFGVKRYHNGKATGDYHKGVDLRSPAGRPIRATNSGKVQIAKMYRLHGGTVGLDHGHGIGSIYIHMSKIAVQPGQMVKKGDVIGYVGSTGFASGPHLHWGLYVSGLPVNPNQWVKGVPICR